MGKEEIIDYKIINDEEYQKQLIKDFKQTINAQRVVNKKEQKKMFLPPFTKWDRLDRSQASDWVECDKSLAQTKWHRTGFTSSGYRHSFRHLLNG